MLGILEGTTSLEIGSTGLEDWECDELGAAETGIGAGDEIEDKGAESETELGKTIWPFDVEWERLET